MCFKDKCQVKPKSFLNNDLLSKHQNTHNDLPLQKCPKHFGAKRNMMKHMATKHREDTGVILTCRVWMSEICWQFHEQLIHYQLIQLTTLKLTTVKLTCCLMAEMTDSRQLIEKKFYEILQLCIMQSVSLVKSQGLNAAQDMDQFQIRDQSKVFLNFQDIKIFIQNLT